MQRRGSRKRSVIRKIGTVSTIIGILLMVAGLCLFLWNQRDAYLAGNAADEVLTAVKEEIEDREGFLYEAPREDTELPAVEIDGYEYVGCVSVPTLDLELPVMAEWSYPRLKIAPCRYYGSAAGKDLVIAAHNYPRHFGNLSKLKEHDEVVFTDLNGTAYHYEVEVVDVLAPEALEEMTDTGYDLTLFTCTYGGASRVTVRCAMVAGST